jgi:maltooligosyltrehalose trehalohydrolase
MSERIEIDETAGRLRTPLPPRGSMMKDRTSRCLSGQFTRAVAWRPSLGAYREGGDVTFRVWAPASRRVELVLHPGLPWSRRHRLERMDDGIFTGTFDNVAVGDRYSYSPDAQGPFPDPASRFQPEGVHGPSAIVDPHAYAWSDHGWRGVSLSDAIIYELHVGTFSPAGTFAGVTERLPELADLGITVIELMPVADFPGSRNWGYDGASLFAPSRVYGTPDDLRRLVDVAHGLGLGVLLDVVYNHFGPDGAYASVFSPSYFSTKHASPWGAAVNLDAQGAAHVRDFFIENAQHWVHEYHIDGLRLDATHALVDESPRHFVAELAARVRAAAADRSILLFAEDDRNLASIVRPEKEGGWGLDGVWADDLHHHLRRHTAGDNDGYYADFSGTTLDIARTIRDGWFYWGQWSAYRQAPRGTSSAGVALDRMVVCLQNHDQIGNRPFGTRLHHQIEPAVFRALSALLLFVPETPLLFMGQEWAASSPFLYFTDHHPELGRLVTAGRRAEFSRFAAYADPAQRARIPDPQAETTFDASRLVWDERDAPAHASTLDLYRTLLRLRRDEISPRRFVDAIAVDDACLALTRGMGPEGVVLLVVCLGTPRSVDLTRWKSRAHTGRWEILMTTEDVRFSGESDAAAAPALEPDAGLSVTFRGPAAILLGGT